MIFSVQGTAQLTADFSTDKTGGCKPLAISFSNQTTGASINATYFWDFGNGNTSALLNPGAIFKDELVYNVTLTVKDGNSSSSKTKQITVSPPPTADFTASPVKGCLPVQVDFVTTSTGNEINNFTWDFGDGNILQAGSALQSHTYSVPQKATVSLTISNNFGCTQTVVKQSLVNILPAIQASFSASKTTLCRVTDPVNFTNSSSGPGTLTYAWDFGDGKTSTLKTPSHIFNVRGTYTVTLTVTSSEGCTATSSQAGYINVADFTSDFIVPSPICQGATVTFNSTSTPPPLTREWLVDGVTAYYYNINTLDYNFATTGTHTIQLKNNFGGCADSVSKKITVSEVPDLTGFIISSADSCGAPAVYQFKDTTHGATKWEWDFTHTIADDIQSNLQAPTFTYNTDGGYSVLLKVANAAGCKAITIQSVGISGPYVSVSADGEPHPCGPYSKKFFASSTDSIVVYKWNFGDGTTSALPQPTHLFSVPGNYSVTLSYTTAKGCKGTASYGNLDVFPKPVANFSASASTLCGNTPVTFTAVEQGLGIYYSWDFGDNSSNYGFNTSYFTHQYNYDSVYTVRLIVSTINSCSDTLTKTNFIKVLPPFPRITGASNTCDGNRGLVAFTQDSKKALTWLWNFGDGTTRSFNTDSPSVSHNYGATGSYKAVLTTTNGQCSVRDSVNVYVLLKQKPLFTASASNICTSDKIQVTINHLENNPWPATNNTFYYLYGAQYNDLSSYGGLIDYNQNYNWGSTFNGSFAQFEKGKTGIRTITRSVGFDCADTTNFIPLSIKGSTAGFEVITSNVCFKSPVVLRDSSKTNSKLVFWQWDFGDGTVLLNDHGGTISHEYANPGGYNVGLVITDTSGCSANSNSQLIAVTVNGPKASFIPSANNTFITLPVYFNNNTNNYNSNNTGYSWAFGDGTVSSDFSPQHAYDLPGKYIVKLIAKNIATNCADTASQDIIVNNFNPAFAISSSFLTADNCPPLLVRLSNNSINYNTVKWDFGDGNTADNLNYPAHIYEKPGRYIITLYVYGPSGLTGTYIDSISIMQSSATLRIDKKIGCTGLIATLNATVKNSSAYTWDLGDGSLVSNDDSTITHQYNTAGVFKPWLMLTDSNGCNTFSSLNDSIIISKGPDVMITPADPTICAGQSIVLKASGGVTYKWSPAKGLDNVLLASPTAAPLATEIFKVTVKDEIGCSDSGSTKVTVIQ
ncbi:MAG: PKD domain-containing protein, partial [Ferruginibacter sp.]